MAIFRHETRLPFPPAIVRAWHTRPGAFERLQSPWGPAEVIERTGTVAEGDRLVMKVPPGIRWVAVHHDHPDGFVDEMVEGPMTRWRHTHSFLPDGDGCLLVDEIDYDFIGPEIFVTRMMKPMFAFRAARLAADLARAPTTPLRIAIAGSSGMIGSALIPFLTTQGHTVLRLVRREAGPGELRWDPKGPLVLPEVDAVLNLAGEGIADDRWSAARKVTMRSSRVDTTTTLAHALADRPEVAWVNGSAIGIYGNRGDEEVDESSTTGTGYLADLCRDLEAAAVAPGRVVRMRIGIVLSKGGGALAKMLTPALFGANGPLGTGQHWQSWIGIDDMVYVLHRALTDASLSGPVNACGPNPVRQIDLARALGARIGRPAVIPAPAFALRAMFGEMADEAILASTRAVPMRLGEHPWLMPGIDELLKWELGK